MVDVAVPIHGKNRIKHVLAALGCADRLWQNEYRFSVGHALLALLVSMSVVGCTEREPTVVQSGQGLSNVDWQSLLDSDGGAAVEASSVSLPRDLRTHAQSPAESFSLKAIVFDDQLTPISVHAQWDRLTVSDTRNTTDNSLSGESDWSYDSVFRAQVATGTEGDNQLSSRQLFERGALGLAGSDTATLHVGVNSLKVAPSRLSGRPCLNEIRAETRLLPDAPVNLNSERSPCPLATSISDVLNQWEAMAVPVSGFVAGQSVAGHAWLVHTWGLPPPNGGAVVFDQIRLRLVSKDGVVTLLNANRSKRRSGKGPVTVLASVMSDHNHPQRTETLRASQDERWGTDNEPVSVDLEWFDGAEESSALTGIDYATSFELSSRDLGLNVQVSPVVPLSEIVDTSGARWSGAVQLSGSHGGTGYLDIEPVESAKREN